MLETYYQAVAFLGVHLGIVFVMVFLISFLECIRCTVKGEFRKRPLIVAIISLYVLVVSIQYLAAMQRKHRALRRTCAEAASSC